MVKEVKPKKKQERGDKIRNRAKVLKEIIKDPTQSQRAIAKKTGTSVATVNKNIQELPKSNKDEHITNVIENDAKIVTLGQKLLLQRMQLAEQDPESKLATRDIISATDLSGKRHMMLQGDVTDKKGGLKESLTIKLPEG